LQTFNVAGPTCTGHRQKNCGTKKNEKDKEIKKSLQGEDMEVNLATDRYSKTNKNTISVTISLSLRAP